MLHPMLVRAQQMLELLHTQKVDRGFLLNQEVLEDQSLHLQLLDVDEDGLHRRC